MQTNRIHYLIATTVLVAIAFGAAPTSAQTTNTRVGELKYENGYPTKETVDKLYDEMDLQRASQAYMWSFPAVSVASIRAGLFRDLGATYNGIVLYQDFLDPRSLWLTGNNTTIYATSQMTLKDGPVVLEVPAGPTAGMFGDSWFITTGVGSIGPDKGNGGKYLLLPPGYQGELPKEGYFITPLKTVDANYFIRGIVVAGNVAAAGDMIAKSRIYPYSERANPKPNRVLRVWGKYVNTIEPEGFEYWKLLSEVINNNPVQERDRFFMAMLGRSLRELLDCFETLRRTGVDLYLDQQGVDKTTPAGRALFGMAGVFAEFERSMLIERTRAGLHRARAQGKRLGRPITPDDVTKRIHELRCDGMGMDRIARELGIGKSVTQRICQKAAEAA